MKKLFLIDESNINVRLDRWFRRNVLHLPQSLIEKNIRKGNIKVNKKKKKSSYKLKEKDEILVNILNYKNIQNKKNKNKYIPTKRDHTLSSDIFIENNENFAVINKPAGIAVQSGTKSKRNILDILSHTKEFENIIPFTVHRIDKETTGVLLVAKNRKYAQLLTSLFRLRKIHKTYIGIVLGEFEKKKGTFIDDLIYYEGDKKIVSRAITHYSVIDSNKNYSLLKLSPTTGRKHQLRKQLFFHGYPILGDTKYKFPNKYKSTKNFLMLHAYKINFSINDKKYNFLADIPDIFKLTLKEKYLKISQQ